MTGGRESRSIGLLVVGHVASATCRKVAARELSMNSRLSPRNREQSVREVTAVGPRTPVKFGTKLSFQTADDARKATTAHHRDFARAV
jgi:hypothetical protein